MPLYAVKCKSCGAEDTVFRPIAERNSLPSCKCEGELFRILAAPMLAPDLSAPFQDPNTGQAITSRREWKEALARSGAIPWEAGLDKDIARNRERSYEEAFAPSAKGVDEAGSAAVAAGNLET